MNMLEQLQLIEKAKDMIHNSDLTPEVKIKLQIVINDLKTQLILTGTDNVKYIARIDVYAELLNKLLDKISGCKYD